jgi:formate-dependent nitrite reductase membrane component NrfD
MTDRRPIEQPEATKNGRPSGTVDWKRSITERGTTMDSYYGRPIVKEPVWNPEIPWYFFTGGLAGASAVLHGVARLAGNERLAKSALYVGAAADAISPVLLVKDLGRPERFLHMLRMFKVTSPMSVGSWILVASSGASSTAAALELLGILKPVKVMANVVSFLSGPPLATYTGALVANTAIPVWSEARDELPWLFGASAAASAGAAAAVFTPAELAGPARRAAVAGVAVELGLMQAMEMRLGFVGEVYKQGRAGRFARLSKACTVAGAGLIALKGKRSRTAAVAGGALVLAGEAALRWSVFRAGFQSARDPRYTVLPQKERLAQRKGAQ